MSAKTCNGCDAEKPTESFARHPQNRDGRQNTCRECQSAAVPRRRHGLTREEKLALAVEQGGCPGCGTLDPGGKGWVVDHDHGCCGPIKSCPQCRRGILCNPCNTALGMVRDQAETLRRLAAYLDRHAIGWESVPIGVPTPSTDSRDRLRRTYVQTDKELTTGERGSHVA